MSSGRGRKLSRCDTYFWSQLTKSSVNCRKSVNKELRGLQEGKNKLGALNKWRGLLQMFELLTLIALSIGKTQKICPYWAQKSMYNDAHQCMCTQNSSVFGRTIKYCNKLSWIGTERI